MTLKRRSASLVGERNTVALWFISVHFFDAALCCYFNNIIRKLTEWKKLFFSSQGKQLELLCFLAQTQLSSIVHKCSIDLRLVLWEHHTRNIILSCFIHFQNSTESLSWWITHRCLREGQEFANSPSLFLSLFAMYQCHWQQNSFRMKEAPPCLTLQYSAVQCSLVWSLTFTSLWTNSSVFVLFDEKTFFQKAFGLSIYSNLWNQFLFFKVSVGLWYMITPPWKSKVQKFYSS